MSLEDAEAYKASRSFSNEPNGAVPKNAHAFDDLTDFQVRLFPLHDGLQHFLTVCIYATQNIDFIYVL